jgi:hypothetical protein
MAVEPATLRPLPLPDQRWRPIDSHCVPLSVAEKFPWFRQTLRASRARQQERDTLVDQARAIILPPVHVRARWLSARRGNYERPRASELDQKPDRGATSRAFSLCAIRSPAMAACGLGAVWSVVMS